MGLTAAIYKSHPGDFSNGGISGHASQVVIVNVEGPFAPTDDQPPVLLVRGNLPGTLRIVPAELTDEGNYVPSRGLSDGRMVGPMMGGCFVGTSDSRFSRACGELLGHNFYAAVALHDRYETPVQYEALSS